MSHTPTDTSTKTVTALLEGVTPGPWCITGQPDKVCCHGYTKQGAAKVITTTNSPSWMGLIEPSANARFIAAARELVPALLAERDAANARAERAEAGPKVKPLMWCHHPMGAIASPPTGQAYIIDIRTKGRVMFIKGMNPPPQFDNLEAAKAAAQADYEVRILSALEKPHD